MSTVDATLAKRIAKLFRLLSSDSESEALNAVAAMKRLLTVKGLSLHDIATVIENCDGEIEERRFSESDAKIIYERGVEKGRAEVRTEQKSPPEFYDMGGFPRWNAIALFCQRHLTRLRDDKERSFVNDMAGTLWREPTEKQAKWLLAIFVRLGGRCDPQTARFARTGGR